VRPVLERRQTVWEIVAGAMPLLREHREFRRLVLTGLLGFGMSFTMPFYIVYAKQDLGVPPETAGIYIWAAMFGSAISSIIWGYLNDRRGPATVVRGGCTLVMITPLLAIAIPWLMGMAEGPFPNAEQYVRYVFALVFVAGGASMGAMWMGLTNYLFELTSHEDRPRYLALMNMLTAPGAVAPLLVGWMLTFLPFVVVFSFVAACGAGAAVLSRWLPEPRAAAVAE
jgi:MFS family permease